MNGNLADHGISLRTYRMGTQRTLCPNCSDHRRNKTDRCLSVTIDTEGAKFLCHHCGFKGAVKHEENNIIQHRKTEVEAKPMAVVKPMQTTDLTEQSVAFLSGRGISPETARALNVKSVSWWTNGAQKETDCLAFPYSYQGRIYAAKFRSTEVKAFASNGAPQTFFNEEGVEDWSEIIITEGEMDVLALHEAGFRNAVSIPLGAVNKATNGTPDPREDGKFSFLWRAEEKLKGCKKIIIACDGDGPGKVTAEEIARRVGKDRCWSVDWPEGAKDANDVLLGGGVAGLRDAVSAAKPWPVAGLYEAGHFFDRVRDIYSNGLHAGESTGYPCLDELYTVVPGHMTVVTGVPGSGKSELIDQMMVNLAKSKGWAFAVCSFENPPELHIAKLAQKFMGKPFFSGLYPKMTDAELAIALDFVHMHFSFVHQTDGSLSTIDSILERLKVAVLRHGVRGAVIDPYNYIQKSRESSETDWISEMLSRVKAFAMAHGIHVWFVAHPTKLPIAADGTMPIPNGMTISGCYDAETEVLTSHGWISHRDVNMGNSVACYDPASGEISYQKPEVVHQYFHDGIMHHWKSGDTDMLVTPNHRMVMMPAYRNKPKSGSNITGRPPVWKMDEYQFINSENVTGTRWWVPTSGNFHNGDKSPVPESLDGGYESNPFWWYVGFWLAEGCVQSGGLSVCQADDNSSKPRAIMNALHLDRSDKVTNYNPVELPMWVSRIRKKSHPELTRFIVSECGEGCDNKSMPDAIWSASREEKISLLQGLLFGDGNVCGSTVRLTTTSKKLADDTQRLATELGKWAYIRNEGKAKDHHKTRYVVTIRAEDKRTLEVRRNRSDVQYSGMVYCLTVPTGAYITRRNGRIAYQGNSAAWFAKADMGLTVHRPDRQHSNAAEVHVWKVRFNWTGKEGVAELMYRNGIATYVDPRHQPAGVTPF